MRNVILIGMPGCGKSTVGVLAAKALTMDFVDTDLLLQRKAGRPLQRMVDELGAEGFAHVEEACVCGLEARGTVIATGGSVATEDAAMEHLKEISEVVYLKMSYEEMENRIGNVVDRGVALKPGFTLRDLYNERVPYYEKYADITIDEEGKTPGETVDALRDIIEGMMDRSMIERIVEEQKKILEEKDRKIEAYEAEIAALKEELALFRAEETGGCGN